MALDLRWKVRQSNQLWLKWKSKTNIGDGKIELQDAEFYGPVLSDCLKLDPSGFINIDLTKHFIILIPKPYLVKMIWESVISQDNNSIKLGKVFLEDTDLGHLNKMNNNDLLLLDATGHTSEEEAKGHFKYSFAGMLYKSDMTPYDFSS